MEDVTSLENTLEFKNIKKILMRNYSWILDVFIPEDYYRYQTTLFLNIVIDPYKLQQEKGWAISTLTKFLIRNTSSTEKYAFNASGPDRIYKGPEEEMERLKTEINNLLEMIRKAFDLQPKDLMTENKKIKIGSWIIPTMPIPNHAIFS